MDRNQLDVFKSFTDGELDRRRFISKLVALSGGTAAAASLLPQLTATALAQPPGPGGPPGVSLAERDRRFDVSRQLMGELGLDALLIPGNGGGVGQPLYAYWFSNLRSVNPWAVVLPREGDPAVLGAGAFGGQPWIGRGSGRRRRSRSAA